MGISYSPSLGRIPVVNVSPTLESGRWPVRAVVGEAIPITAEVFREGHDAESATAVVTLPDGSELSLPMDCTSFGLSHYRAVFIPTVEGEHHFRVEGWSDPFETWHHAAEAKIRAGVDVQLMLDEGALLFDRLLKIKRPRAAQALVKSALAALTDAETSPEQRLAATSAKELREVLRAYPLRDDVTPTQEYPLVVQRERALYSAWYEIFPRSEGAKQHPKTDAWTSGTFTTAAKRLPQIADMGFDVVYLTPIHPIGLTHRKGRNNSLQAEPGDPGSPYAIGAESGGHDAIHPELGTMRTFKTFVKKAHEAGLEVALDVALQCSPDHPWVVEHPEWFTTRIDGTIAYAENPPKKYQDIYPLNFDNDPEGIYQAIRDMLQVWIDAGVTLFRVDNPHTKPLDFWERLLAHFAQTHPDVIFLAEAFTRPAMMHTLAKIGFHQSYTYFTWRQDAGELATYLEEVSGASSYYMRPNFWPTTHDILTPDMQQGGAPLYQARAVLAATGSPSYGIYTGYEFVENVPRPGVEEQIDNEKYEFKNRDWSQADRYGIKTLLTTLNRVRSENLALQRLRGLTIHRSDNPQVIFYSRHVPADESPTGVPNTVLVAVSLDATNAQEATISLDMKALGLGDSTHFDVDDMLTGEIYRWSQQVYVRLSPQTSMAHVAVIRLR